MDSEYPLGALLFPQKLFTFYSRQNLDFVEVKPDDVFIVTRKFEYKSGIWYYLYHLASNSEKDFQESEIHRSFLRAE